MARIHRRKLLQLSGAGAVAAKTGGIAAILAASRAPAYAQGATRSLAALERLCSRVRRTPEKGDRAGGREGARHQAQYRDHQRQRSAGAHHIGDPVGLGPDVICGLNNWPQLYAESVADVDDIVEEIGKAQGGFYEESKVVANDGKKWLGVPWCVIGAMIVYRKSWFAEQGVNNFPATWEAVPCARQEAEGRRPSDRADSRPYLRRCADLHISLSVVLGRQGSRGGRQDRRAQFEGSRRLREVHDRVLEGSARRRRARLGRHQQQPRLPLRHDQRYLEWRLDLSVGARASPTPISTRRASRCSRTWRIRPCPRARRASSAITCR